MLQLVLWGGGSPGSMIGRGSLREIEIPLPGVAAFETIVKDAVQEDLVGVDIGGGGGVAIVGPGDDPMFNHAICAYEAREVGLVTLRRAAAVSVILDEPPVSWMIPEPGPRCPSAVSHLRCGLRGL